MGFIIIPNPHPMCRYPAGYDFRPAPIIDKLVVNHEDKDDGVAVLRAILDTGADCSLLAPWALELLEMHLGRLPSEGPLYFMERRVPAYKLSFSFDQGGHWFDPGWCYQICNTN